MTEYITREAMLAAIQDWDDGTNMDIFTNEVREMVRAIPPVKVVAKCKNCLHFTPRDFVDEMYRDGICSLHGGAAVGALDGCSRGREKS